MSSTERETAFEEQMSRIRLVTGIRTSTELATFFGCRRSHFSDARRRGCIPEEWLLILARLRNINPDWILTGRGARFLAC